MSIKVEYRSTTLSLRAAPDSAFVLAGLAAQYGKLSCDLGGFRERLAPGCFTRSLSTTPDVVCLYNHDPSKILGRTKSGTLTLTDSDEGLGFRCQLDPNQQAHRDIHASVKRGDISECSFAFSVDGADGDAFDEASEGGKRFTRRTLRSLNLHDVSIVTTPAYPGSTHVAARSQTPRNYLKSPEWQNEVQKAYRLIADQQAAREAEQEEAARISAVIKAELFPWEK